MQKLRDHEASYCSTWTVNAKMQPFKDARDLLRAAGEDVSELERSMAYEENAMTQLKAVASAAMAAFANRDLMVVTDKKKIKDVEQSLLQ